ncbi:MAG: hypothetical protein ACI4KF_03655 [Huintestinicola sp.]
MDKQDYISREEARSTLSIITNDATCPLSVASEIEFLLDMVPAVDVAPVRYGHWTNNKHTDTAVCSECKRVFTDETNYCPNCGAQMGGSE